MNERVVALRVGIVVLAAAFITGFLIILMGEGKSLWQGRYTIYLRFPQAPGVAVDTPVRKNGVLIGRVTHIDLQDEGVIITARIDAGRRIYANEICHIRSSSLLGDAVLEFVRSEDTTRPRTLVQDLTYINDGVVASDPIRVLSSLEGDVRRAVNSIESAANNFSTLSARLSNSLGDDQQLPRLMQKTELALDKFRVTLDSFDELLGDDELRNKLKQGLADFPATLEEMRLTMSRARESMDGFQELQIKAGRNLDNLERFSKPLGDRGEQLASNMNDILKNLNDMTTEVATLASSIRDSNGSLARLIRDDELYTKVLDTVDALRDAARRLRPILDDARIFSDKIARDPGVLGARGALEGKVGTGFKGMVPQLRAPASWQERLGVE
jgi:phospholipid/cholesterol/gamma-HCH transport system substrate-binding protein